MVRDIRKNIKSNTKKTPEYLLLIFETRKSVWFCGSYLFVGWFVRTFLSLSAIDWFFLFVKKKDGRKILPNTHFNPIFDHYIEIFKWEIRLNGIWLTFIAFVSTKLEPFNKVLKMLDIKGSADYLSRSTGSFSNFSMLFAGNNNIIDSNGFLSHSILILMEIQKEKFKTQNETKRIKRRRNEWDLSIQSFILEMIDRSKPKSFAVWNTRRTVKN